MLPINFQSAFVDTQAIDLLSANGPLSGLKLAVKDLFDIQGIPTAAGNKDWLASHPIPNHTNSCVLDLMRSGAQYVGKTLTDELAYSLNGQNIHYPPLKNPITPQRIIGGSSSGSAAAVALGAADIGLGTDTGGSIRVPASYNGLFGIRTTHGAIARDNMVELAPSFDTVGWLTRDLDIMERVTRVLLTTQDDTAIQTNPKLLVLTNLVEQVEQSNEIYKWLASLNSTHQVEKSLDVNALQTSKTFRVLQGAQIWQQHADWITKHNPKFASDISDRLTWCQQITVPEIESATQQKAVINQAIDKVMTGYDAIVIPTTPGRAPLCDESASRMVTYREELMALTAVAGLTGLPQIHLPLFSIDGAPCGVSLIGHKHSDLSLIKLARVLIDQSSSESYLASKENYE